MAVFFVCQRKTMISGFTIGQAIMSTATLVVAIFIQYSIAKQFESVAGDKGYSDSRYYHFCFRLDPVG